VWFLRWFRLGRPIEAAVQRVRNASCKKPVWRAQAAIAAMIPGCRLPSAARPPGINARQLSSLHDRRESPVIEYDKDGTNHCRKRGSQKPRVGGCDAITRNSLRCDEATGDDQSRDQGPSRLFH
jgi:hypothetical protein